jgi:hypothetical protein
MIRNAYGRNAQSHEIKAMLGLADKAKLPSEGMALRDIQGYSVWVKPLPSIRDARFHCTHRVMAECPRCLRVLSAGRLHQHKCQVQT